MEKQFEINAVSNSPNGGSLSDVDNIDVDWTPEEEKSLVRKLDRTIMPLLILGFFALQLDRGNIGNALTDDFFADVGITQNQFNVGQQLLSLGIVLLEIPSNIVLYRVGPSLWIGGQIVAWGLVATFQAFQKGLASFLVTRLLLGLCEAGFIPAGFYTITRWYKNEETSKRFSWYFIGNQTASGCAGLLAYAILHMRGVAGLTGWQWMFLIEGMFTVVVGVMFLSLFPQNTANPVSLLGLRLFNDREAKILTKRILANDPSKVNVKVHISRKEMKNVFTNWKLIPHIILTIACIAPAGTMGSYAPTLVASFGYERLKSNALVSIGYWILMVVNIAWGTIADKIRLRGPMVTLGLVIYWCFTLGNRLLINSSNGKQRLAVLICALSFAQNWHPVNGSWMALNSGTPGERSITLAIQIMSANTGGIIGSQIFQAKDGPLYPVGWSVILGLVTLGVVCSVLANLQYFILNGRKWTRKGLKYFP
ncbi:major facilitator superfamily domain-containing protein [Dactylonectria estremocensis]|uniref:Major facilitator superfamily domain-containing protein n=1 Tax=Dactylonectria estremocensis TaxID=1079267 RepID=A0A9P9F4G3_9HYPO|nr:major facilitator superfamily domain-containing protein [Dactylonectria estremocensis]